MTLKKIYHHKYYKLTLLCTVSMMLATIPGGYASWTNTERPFLDTCMVQQSVRRAIGLGFSSLSALLDDLESHKQKLGQEEQSNRQLTTQITALQQQNSTLTTQLRTGAQTSQELRQANQKNADTISALQGKIGTSENQLRQAQQQLADQRNRIAPGHYQGNAQEWSDLMKIICSLGDIETPEGQQVTVAGLIQALQANAWHR